MFDGVGYLPTQLCPRVAGRQKTIGLHLWGMATGPDDVRSWGQTGSSRLTTKVTRLTPSGN
jgi:hypothetical protein